MTMQRRQHGVDQNQKEIVQALKKIGASVLIVNGVVDIIVGYRDNNGTPQNFMFEIKNPKLKPSQRALTEAEVKFHSQWKGQLNIIETWQDAFVLIGAMKKTIPLKGKVSAK